MDDLEEELYALERILCGQKEPDSLDFRLLQRLTGNFSDDRRIGEGGCGEVYKGELPNGKVIAVKKLRKSYIIDEKMFLCEVDSMIKVQHQNIVRFLGYCSEIKEKAVLMDGKFVMAEEREKLLCFPYISYGSLDKYLTDELRGFEWHTRYQIIKGICDGLLYLHKEKGIMHMDLKPANILLGDQMVPKITDFGVSRIDGKTQITSAQRLFSRGYTAPEYIDTGERSWKSDIYSLGVIMIELVTGSMTLPNTTKVLRRWRHRWNKSSKHTPLSYLQVKKCLKLAVSCQEKNPVNRPFIWDVVCELNKLDSWDGRIRESSIEKIISSSDDMLGIKPLELHFTLAHHKQQISPIELTNNTDYYMAFRIATTSPLPFSIQPEKGIAAPGSKCTASITLSAQEMTPLLYNLCDCKEEFIVQSTRIDGNLTAVDITVDMFDEEGGNSLKKIDDGDKVVDKVILTVRFGMLHEEHQKDQANLSAEMGSLGASSQEVQQSMELSSHQDYGDPRMMDYFQEALEEVLADESVAPVELHFWFLKAITQDFSDNQLISSGGFGSVYKGVLRNGVVAVKKLHDKFEVQEEDCQREVACLIKMEHKNIVRFLGYSYETQHIIYEHHGINVLVDKRNMLFCFEYLSKGSLSNYLTASYGLQWEVRFQLINGICEGVRYLHQQGIIHMDLKPDNILLDDSMMPRISDFCISRRFTGNQSRIITKNNVRSWGYMAPEFLKWGIITLKTDIYSIGVIIIEILMGPKECPTVEKVLESWTNAFGTSKSSPLLEQVKLCAEIGIRCMHDDRSRRPDIQSIISSLRLIKQIFQSR